MLLEIDNLHVSIDEKEILKGLTLSVHPGEIHAIMGPNGAGKSTLARVLAGHSDYEVTSGDIRLNGESILELDPEERAKRGVFMSFQYPPELPGVSNEEFLYAAYNARTPISQEDFAVLLREKIAQVGISEGLVSRSLNENFSGGEKKHNEILQMAVLDPLVAILDETDSGLDIDALRAVASGVNRLMTPQKGLLLITHYQRLLDYIHPQFVHVMIDGRIARSGGPELAHELEKSGYAI